MQPHPLREMFAGIVAAVCLIALAALEIAIMMEVGR